VKPELSTVANVVTIATCVLVAYIAVGSRTTKATTGGRPPIEEVTNVTTSLPQLSVIGDPGAKTVVIEFTDFQCPFCRRHARDTFPDIKKEFIDTWQIRWAGRQFPLDAHLAAYDAARAASCAARQNQYWAMHERLFAIQSELAVPAIMAAAKDIELSHSQFEACMSAQSETVDADRAEGVRLGVASTPTFVIGTVDGRGDVQVKRRVRGVNDVSTFREVITNVARIAAK
jgi:protein-disulfide isomerase